ncbi:SDR family NAD(P)-dependent oxidoreductase [Sphingobium sp. CFD-1]|uniref:SDR family NAD(P)-dependent oxidoreductase n=1 Tax=Sphingobium sp. CFD-1 TaxID=2878545 RepID=UPI00214BE8FC|nr:SDR family NAD(P)-dependent oxidoreductase [Sphingobium sp. CFD-1]
MSEKIVLVTGATRGLGRGMARGLAARGNMVAVTGRDSAQLAEVVVEIERAGGKGLALECDHNDDGAVERAFAQLAERTDGKLDLLVNNAAAVYGPELVAPGGFWEKPLKLADMITIGLRSSYVAAYYAAPMMVAAGKGLIASISFYGAVSYFHGAAYGAAKAGTDKMTADMAVDLAPHGVSVVSFWPGFILTDAIRTMPPEMMPEELRASLPNWETPEFSGLVLDRLAEDPDLAVLSGKALIGAELGERYGIRDTDGKQPISYRAMMGAPISFMPPPQG